MASSRLRRRASIAGLVLAAVAVGHELTYVLAHGLGTGYDAAMNAGGHDDYWGGFLLTVAIVSATLAGVALTQWRRLRRLAAALDAGRVHVAEASPRHYAAILGSVWRRVALLAVIAYTVQENIETAAAGGPWLGIDVLAGHDGLAVPALLLASVVVSAVGALAAWRRRVLLSRIRAVRALPRPAAPMLRPVLDGAIRPTLVEVRRNGVRAPPLVVTSPA